MGAVNCLKLAYEVVNKLSLEKDIFPLTFPSISAPPKTKCYSRQLDRY